MNFVNTIWLTCLVLVVLMINCGQPAQAQSPEDPVKSVKLFERMGVVESSKIVESSGLAVSHQRDCALWTHNDSGQSATLFCISLEGETICELTISDATNDDWEAMSNVSIEGVPYLLIADVGDNLVKRTSCQLYLLPEPDFDLLKTALKKSTVAQKINFRFEDGPKNCEAVAVDPLTNDVWLIEKVYFDSKQTKPPGIYRTTLPTAKVSDTQVAKRIADFPIRNVTGADFSPDGNYLIICNYLSAHLYSRDPEMTWLQTVREKNPTPIPLPLQRQGEAICFAADSKSLFVTSESAKQPIWRINFLNYLKQLEAND